MRMKNLSCFLSQDSPEDAQRENTIAPFFSRQPSFRSQCVLLQAGEDADIDIDIEFGTNLRYGLWHCIHCKPLGDCLQLMDFLCRVAIIVINDYSRRRLLMRLSVLILCVSAATALPTVAQPRRSRDAP
jgi:hypothetical protein